VRKKCKDQLEAHENESRGVKAEVGEEARLEKYLGSRTGML
jgi:hypothetical protein